MLSYRLNNTMRMLWERHVAWTRMFIISAAAGLPDEQLVMRRLLRNVPDMSAVFKIYYGEAIASRFAALYHDHLVIAAEMVKAGKAGDAAHATAAETRWYANADEIAVFLSGINPNWNKQSLIHMLHDHLRLTRNEAIFRLTGDFASDIAVYDEIERQALMMSDALTQGIVMQFPNILTAKS